MKKQLLLFVVIISCANAIAQVPFFGTSPGKNNLYSYTQLEFVPGSNAQGNYIFSQYGITDNFSAGIEFAGGTQLFLHGYNLKYQFIGKDYLNLAIQTSAYMNMLDYYKFDHQSFVLLANGNITNRVGYVSNTYLNIYSDGSRSANQYWYLNCTFNSLMPFVGMTNNWTGDFDADLTIGLAYNIGVLNIYAWSGYLCSGSPLYTIGFDYQFNLKQ